MKRYREATEKDVLLIIGMIKELARYENAEEKAQASEEDILNNVIHNKHARVIFAINDEDKEVGFALFFYNFSTWTGKKGLYLEDLFVLEEYRKQGFGKFLIKTLGEIAIKEDCARFEWQCLDWNKPSIDFYLSLGAKPMNEWTQYRLEGKSLLNIVNK